MSNLKRASILVLGGLMLPTSAVVAADPVDFNKQIKPLFEAHCISCHGEEKPKGALRMTTLEGILKGGDDGAALVAGDPAKSTVYTSTTLAADHDDVMPPSNKGGPLGKEITDVLKQWIAEGAKWPEGVKLAQVPKVDFVKDVQPILEFNCVACHREGEAKGKLRLDTRKEAFTSGEEGPTIIPFFPEKSATYTSTVLPADHDDLMPPAKKGGPMPKEKTEVLRRWIEQGAFWPEGVTLTPKKAEEAAKGDENSTVKSIHERIVKVTKEKSAADMKAYQETIPGTAVSFDMIPIPAGEFLMGSPDGEAGRNADEGPAVKVKLSPFWMGKMEVTWTEYEIFMRPEIEADLRKRNATSEEGVNALSDAISRPTKPYVEMSFGMGKDGFPAISMTHHAANKYCEWLSARTGHYYRLPTEAEWEYACRAGTTTKYSFGDDESVLGEYAWWGKNSDWKYQKVGRKKPNPWGLHDMHGNVLEWTLDQYDADWFKKNAGKVVEDPWTPSTTPYPHAARGGSWDNEEPAPLRSAARRASDKTWKIQDPQLPKSIWYHTDAQFLGFRVVRPLNVPAPEQLKKIWNNGVERD